MSNVNYESVNEALSVALLSGRFKNRALYLCLDKSSKDEVAKQLGVDPEDVEELCCRVVGNNLYHQGNVYQTKLLSADTWSKTEKREFPPFIAILYTLSHAAELMAAEGDLAPNNYYERLASVTGLSSDRLRKDAKHTGVFWQMLSSWLVENDYEYGRPTAVSKGKWKYVGLAMSQAIIRASDRELFHNLFVTYGFSAGDRLSVEEIKHYLDGWIYSSASSPRLKAAWQKKELRIRVCKIALEEFYDWSIDNTTRSIHSVGNFTRNLTLMASIIYGFPSSKLSLNLGRAGEMHEPLVELKDASGNIFNIGNSKFGAFATISPNPLGQKGSGVSREFCIGGSLESLKWVPRVAIPLTQSSDGPFWAEVARTSIGADHLILVRDIPHLVSELNEYLTKATTKNEMRISGYEELDGVPKGWLLYHDIRFKRDDIDVCKDLQHLVPFADGLGFSMSGGLRLDRGIWHSKKPPTVFFKANSAPTKIEITKSGGNQNACIGILESKHPSCSIDIPKLRDGTFTFVGYQRGKKIDEHVLLLRSATRPRPIHRQLGGQLEPRDIFSANLFAEPLPKLSVRGHIVSGSTLVDISVEIKKKEYIGQVPHAEEEIEYSSDFVVSGPEDLVGETCVSRGHHHWIGEYHPPYVPTLKRPSMTCNDCNVTVLQPVQSKKPNKPNQKAELLAPRTRTRFSEPVVRPIDKVDLDIFMDALSFLGSGTWGRMDALISTNDEPPWRTTEIGTEFSALGLIDLKYHPSLHRPSMWSVPPPAVVFYQSEEAFLSGFRSSLFVNNIGRIINENGGRAVVEKTKSGLTQVWIKGINPVQLSLAIKNELDPHRRPISVIEKGAENLAGAFAQLGGFAKVLVPISTGSGLRNLQKFDVGQVSWKDLEDIRGPGAYRFDFSGRTYVYRTRDGSEYSGPQQIVKLLAARAAGKRLHGYDADNHVFVSTRGAEPIGLLERALVACSGRLSSKSEKGWSTYSNVSPKIAAIILDVLYQKEIL